MALTNSSQDSWQILTCKSCSGKMKVRAGMEAGTRVLCPSCGTAVGRALPEARTEEFTGGVQTERPMARPEGVNLLAEWDEELGPQLPEEAGSHEGEQRVRVKKRRAKSTQARGAPVVVDWDSQPGTGKEVVADPWVDAQLLPEDLEGSTNERIVTEEVDAYGRSVRRIKNVKKTKVLGLAQLFFRRLSFSARVTAITLASAVLLTGVVFGGRALVEKYAPKAEGQVPEDFSSTRAFLSNDNLVSAVGLIEKFYAAPTLEEKLKCVRLPARVRPMMEKYYQTHSLQPLTIGSQEEFTKLSPTKDTYFVMLSVMVNEPDPFTQGEVMEVKRFFAVEEILTKDNSMEYLLDWEIAMQHQEMSLDEFKQSQPTAATPFRCQMRLSPDGAYYNHGFIDPTEWTAVELVYPGQDDFKLHGYLSLKTEVGRRYDSYFKERPVGEVMSCVAKLKYPPNAPSRSQVIVDEVVQESWFFEK